MHGGRRDAEVLLHFSLRWRTSVDFAVVINERQILTLFGGVRLRHSQSRISQRRPQGERRVNEDREAKSVHQVAPREIAEARLK